MAINVDGFSVLAPPAKRQQLHTEARQGRWLYELEHALLLQSDKKQGGSHQTGGERSDPGELLLRTERESPVPRAADNSGAESAAAAGVAAGAAAAAALSAATPAVSAPAANDAVAGPQGAAALTAAGNANSATFGRAAAPGVDAPRNGDDLVGADGKAAQATNAPIQPPGWSAAADGQLANEPTHAAGWIAAVGAPSAATVLGAYGAAMATLGPSRGGSGGAPSGGASAIKAATGAAPGQPQAMGFGPGAERAPNTDGGEADILGESPAARNRSAAIQPDGEQYAERRMHVFQDAQGVRAWIRDAAIGGAQVAGLAQAMSGELVASGAPLTALTVNGRRVALPAAALHADALRDDYTTDDESGAERAAAESPTIIYENGAI